MITQLYECIIDTELLLYELYLKREKPGTDS